MTRVRIGIDGYNLAMPNGTGIATYGKVLGDTIRAGGGSLDGVFGIDVGRRTELRETLFFDAIGRPEQPTTRRQRRRLRMADYRRAFGRPAAVEVPLGDGVQKQAFEDRLPVFDRLWSAPRLFEAAHRYFNLTGRLLAVRMADPPPIMHWTYPVPVRLVGARNLYALHDLVPLRLPYTTLDAKTRYHALIAACIAGADHICTVSEASLADIRGRFAIDETRITNTYQASPMRHVADAATAEADGATIGSAFGLSKHGYFLFFGAIEPKKNLGRLIEAYLSIGTETPLVIVGARAWQAEEELRLISASTAAGSATARIVRLEYLPRRVLAALVRCARAVLFPSLFEGFGLPALEAMQQGAPVLASNTGALPEVTGDAALAVDPYDVEAIAGALRRLDGDAGLRETLAARGPRQAELFSRDRYRERLFRMYDAILAAPPRRGR